jgi:hypothetical protein
VAARCRRRGSEGGRRREIAWRTPRTERAAGGHSLCIAVSHLSDISVCGCASVCGGTIDRRRLDAAFPQPRSSSGPGVARGREDVPPLREPRTTCLRLDVNSLSLSLSLLEEPLPGRQRRLLVAALSRYFCRPGPSGPLSLATSVGLHILECPMPN